MKKPLGRKSYTSIPHLIGSNNGPADHTVDINQHKIATVKVRDKHDLVIVQEKLDGTNVGVAKVDNVCIPIGRAGYPAISSQYQMHKLFAKWVYDNYKRFYNLLVERERVCGEWLALAHGTKYKLIHEPFVPFDLMTDSKRVVFDEFSLRVKEFGFTIPHTIHYGESLSIEDALKIINVYGFHGAQEQVEGCVWRIERNALIVKHNNRGPRKRRVDFLCKYIIPNKEPGKYLPDRSGEGSIWNWYPITI